MINELLNEKNWNAKTNEKFFRYLKDFTNEEKCEIIYDVTRELMKRGDEESISCAEIILICATQQYFDVESTHYKALVYYRLGELYECHKENFIKAYTAYKKYELNNINFGGVHAVLLRALLLRDDFTYSEEMEKELNLSYGESDLGLRKDRLYENIGTLITAQNNGDEKTAEMLKKRIKAIIKADEYFFLDLVFRKDATPDYLPTPKKLIDYINTL
ncbi:MAG: hypothetical protein IJ025_05340 [Clostridia bacterium]|nr:hypothetical protein [Clostridia bacterium]